MSTIDTPLHSRQRELDGEVHRHRRVDLEPQPHATQMMLLSSLAPLGLGIAATVTTYLSTSEKIAITAWVAVAIVGAASVISAAAASRSRHVETDIDRDIKRTVNRE